jgi:hypothetical protein
LGLIGAAGLLFLAIASLGITVYRRQRK